jgi:hypothetical protein
MHAESMYYGSNAANAYWEDLEGSAVEEQLHLSYNDRICRIRINLNVGGRGESTAGCKAVEVLV